jgi:hypothetical protein
MDFLRRSPSPQDCPRWTSGKHVQQEKDEKGDDEENDDGLPYSP